MTEGHFAAFPLGMEHESLPIRPEESHITTLGLTRDGQCVFGATGGAACHCFVSCRKGSIGGVIDLGEIEGARRVAALAEGTPDTGRRYPRSALLAICEMQDGAPAVFRIRYRIPENTIQEPGFSNGLIKQTCELPDGGAIASGVQLGNTLVCAGESKLFLVSATDGTCNRAETIDGPGPASPILAVSQREAAWIATDGTFCRTSKTGRTTRHGCPRELPKITACTRRGGEILCASENGEILGWDIDSGCCAVRAVLDLLPVQCMAALADGRVYGTCGDGICHFFRMDSDDTLQPLGSMASVIHSIRHGQEFSCALTTPEGVVYLGEHDRGGHLWAFFPPIPLL